jgi:hypothetical protein
MKEMGFQLVHSIYGKTEESVIGKAAQNMAPESTLSGSAVASQLRVLFIDHHQMLLAMIMGNMGH